MTRDAAGVPGPLSVQIASPQAAGTVRTGNASITLSGTAAQTSGIAWVSWASTAGASGPAKGTSQWNTGGIPLSAGFNRILVTAADNTGQLLTVFLDVIYTPGSRDTTAPSISILFPASTSYLTSESEITLSGTASDDMRVSQVTWMTSSGRTGTAAGTANWSTGPIALPVGTTAIVVRAWDAAGNAGWRSIVVTRQ